MRLARVTQLMVVIMIPVIQLEYRKGRTCFCGSPVFLYVYGFITSNRFVALLVVPVII